jgi:uncharacterized protein (DUF885 family)
MDMSNVPEYQESIELNTVSQEYFALKIEVDPLLSGLLGAPGCNDRLPDLSSDQQRRAAATLRSLEQRVREIETDGLSDQDKVTKGALAHELTSLAAELERGGLELTFGSFTSPHGQLFLALPKSSGGEHEYLARLTAVDRFLQQAAERFRDAARRGRTHNRRSLQQAIRQLDAYLDSAQDLLLAPFPESEGVAEVLHRSVRPAVACYRDVLVTELLPTSRPDQQCGLVHLPGGENLYAQAVAEQTTTERTPQELHRLGLNLCHALRVEYAELGQQVFGTSDIDQITDRLRHDPALRYDHAREIEDDARAALGRAEQAVPSWFRLRPRTGCEVSVIDEIEAPDAVLGYYQPPSRAHGRPGRHWINTWQPTTRTRYEYEAIAFHESVPGHHLQVALAQEMDLPDFRRYGYVAAFSEGWALYAERLADEMGLYSSDVARFGMLSFDSWRACRLVVDTGMHALGWSRQRAIEYMTANTALTPENIANEVDRYIAWPGQALSYMCGRIEIDELRRTVQTHAGSRFDIKRFHDAVLRNGGVPLTVLRDSVLRESRVDVDRA